MTGVLAAAIAAVTRCGGQEPEPEMPLAVVAPSGPIADPKVEPAAPASQQGPYYEPDEQGRPTAILRPDAPNMRYAALDHDHCSSELAARAIPFAPAEATKGVATPVRLTGRLHGVSIHSALSVTEAARSPSTVFDCRLLLAMDDFAALAAKGKIVEMVYFGAYRPQSAYGCTAKYAGLQHCAGLAVDIATFKHEDGTVLSVERDFHGHVGTPTCGPTAPAPGSAELWGLVCNTADRAIFNVTLTPNYNAQHFNHFHVEITPDARWMLIH